MSCSSVVLSVPPSVNAIWRAVRAHGGGLKFHKSTKYEGWRQVAVPLCRYTMAKHSGLVSVSIVVFGGKGMRKGRDVDNLIKQILDCLVSAGRITDDSTDHVRRVTAEFVPAVSAKSEARVVVSIENYIEGGK